MWMCVCSGGQRARFHTLHRVPNAGLNTTLGKKWGGERQTQRADSSHVPQGRSRVTWDKTHESCTGRTAVLFPSNILGEEQKH